jgi:hypothetical protein
MIFTEQVKQLKEEGKLSQRKLMKALNSDLWMEKINVYLEHRYSDNEVNTNDMFQIISDCVNAFAEIAELCFKYGKFKDQWEYGTYHLHIYGPELIIISQKTECDYRIGLDRDGIFLSTYLGHCKNIRYMDDSFWKLLLNLSDFDGFYYDEYEFIRDERRKAFPELFKTNKSMIYRILRKYIFDETETDYHYVSESVGEIKLLYSFNYDFNKLVENFCRGFKIMYQLNYMLWKVSDLKNKQPLPKNKFN